MKERMPITASGKINYLFPFSFKIEDIGSSFNYYKNAKTPQDYQNYIKSCTHNISGNREKRDSDKENQDENRIDFIWGIVWIPDNNWVFKPCLFEPNGKLIPWIETEKWEKKLTEKKYKEYREDIEALIAFDEFHLVSDFFHRQPFLRMRLENVISVYHKDSNNVIFSPIYIDLLIFLSLGQGVMIFRHNIYDINIDELISVRLCQFRRNISYNWILDKLGENKRNRELQDIYTSCCLHFSVMELISVYEVKRYATCIEITSFKNISGNVIDFEKFLKNNKAQIYGLLCVDEGWRNVNEKHADKILQEQSFSSREKWLQLSQEVTFMIYHPLDEKKKKEKKDDRMTISHKNAIEIYHRNLYQNRGRSIANSVNYIELVIVQEGYLNSLYQAAKDLAEKSKTTQRELVALRRQIITGCQTVTDSFNVFSGFPDTLEILRGLPGLHRRVQGVLEMIEKLIDDFHNYNEEYSRDIITALSVGLGTASLMAGISIPIPYIFKFAFLSSILTLTGLRIYKHPSEEFNRILIFILLVTLILIVASIFLF